MTAIIRPRLRIASPLLDALPVRTMRRSLRQYRGSRPRTASKFVRQLSLMSGGLPDRELTTEEPAQYCGPTRVALPVLAVLAHHIALGDPAQLRVDEDPDDALRVGAGSV